MSLVPYLFSTLLIRLTLVLKYSYFIFSLNMTSLALVMIRTLLFLCLFLYGALHIRNTSTISKTYKYRALAVSTPFHSHFLHQTPLELWDLSDMGDRIRSLTPLLETIISDPSVDREPLFRYLDTMFPWWNFAETSYTPWTNIWASTVTEAEGIVISVTHADTVLAGHLISTLRNVYNLTLPIEIAYSGELNLPYRHRKLLLAIDPTLRMVNLFDLFDSSSITVTGDAAFVRPFALLASNFQKVVLLDPDAVFLQSPHQLFQTDKGALFFHDRAYTRRGKYSRRDWASKLLGNNEPSTALNESLFWQNDLWDQMDAGVVYMDKGRANVFMSIIFAAWMNTRSVYEGVIEAHVNSKETFWLAAELSSTPYTFSDSYATIVGKAGERLDMRTHQFSRNICSTQSLHLDSEQRPFWFSGSLRRKKTSPSYDFADLTHWIDGSQSLEWQIQGDEFWCAEGEMVELEGTEWGYRIEGLKEEARRIDSMLDFRDSHVKD